MTRPSWDDYYLDMLEMVARRATCDRGKSASIITLNNRIISTGYVGSPPGMKHCDEVGHLLKQVTHTDGTTSEHCMRTLHAEQNAILHAARSGNALSEAVMYCTMEPCRTCAMMIVSVGISRVVAKYEYHRAQESRDILKDAGVKLEVKNKQVMQYK